MLFALFSTALLCVYRKAKTKNMYLPYKVALFLHYVYFKFFFFFGFFAQFYLQRIFHLIKPSKFIYIVFAFIARRRNFAHTPGTVLHFDSRQRC